MKRTTPFARVTPLRARTPLTSATELSRTAPLGRGTPIRRTAPATMRRWRYTGPTDEVREALKKRSGGRCEIGAVCGGFAQGVDPSHRIAKGMGGSSLASTNAVTAILWACRADHDYVEAHPGESYAAGWKVKHGSADPASVPVMIASPGGGVTVFLTPDGAYSTAPPEVPDGA